MHPEYSICYELSVPNKDECYDLNDYLGTVPQDLEYSTNTFQCLSICLRALLSERHMPHVFGHPMS